MSCTIVRLVKKNNKYIARDSRYLCDQGRRMSFVSFTYYDLFPNPSQGIIHKLFDKVVKPVLIVITLITSRELMHNAIHFSIQFRYL